MDLVEQQPAGLDTWDEAFITHTRLALFLYRREVRERSARYLRGLLGPVERKNGWRLSAAVGETDPQRMQRLLYAAGWDADALRDELTRFVAESFGAADGLLRPAVGEHGWPGPERWLLVGRSVSEPTEHGYHLGNAPSETPLESLARVAVARWPIERRRGLGGAQPRGGLALDAPLVPLSTPEARCLLEPSSRPWRYGWRGPPRAERIRPSVGAAITAVVTLVQPYLAERASEPRAPARLPSVCWPGHYGAWFGSGGSGRCPSPNNPRLVSPP